MDEKSYTGTRLLRDWIAKENLTRKDASDRLNSGLPTLDSWLQGHRRPGLAAAQVIEAATSGFVKANDWLTEEEVASVRLATHSST